MVVLPHQLDLGVMPLCFVSSAVRVCLFPEVLESCHRSVQFLDASALDNVGNGRLARFFPSLSRAFSLPFRALFTSTRSIAITHHHNTLLVIGVQTGW
jgi:hypothetical protein